MEDYVAKFDCLGTLDDLPLELIGEEYRARQRWGDRPKHDMFLARFPRRRMQRSQTVLSNIDRELQLETQWIPGVAEGDNQRSKSSTDLTQEFDPWRTARV